jgi:hypothetical protein
MPQSLHCAVATLHRRRVRISNSALKNYSKAHSLDTATFALEFFLVASNYASVAPLVPDLNVATIPVPSTCWEPTVSSNVKKKGPPFFRWRRLDALQFTEPNGSVGIEGGGGSAQVAAGQ